jgi:hypothetical protein
MDQPSIDGVNTCVSEAVASAGGGHFRFRGEVFAGYGFFRNIARDERRRQSQPRAGGCAPRSWSAIGAMASGNRVTEISGLLVVGFDGHAVMSHRRLLVPGSAITFSRSMAMRAICRLCDLDDATLANCEHADAINQASMLVSEVSLTLCCRIPTR